MYGRATILGSQLGLLIKRSARELGFDVDFKLYGGLRTFVKGYFSELFMVKHGELDDEYVVLGDTRPQEAPQVKPHRPADQAKSNALWQAYSNPQSPLTVFLGPDQDLAIVSAVDSAGAIAGRAVGKITAADYYIWAQEYTNAFMADPERKLASDLLARFPASEFAHPWYSLLHKLETRLHVKQWERFRLGKVLDEFRNKLVQLDVSPEKVLAFVQVMRDSRDSARFSSVVVPTPPFAHALPNTIAGLQAQCASTPSSNVNDIERVRRLVHLAVDQLTLDQLRTIPIPVGVLFEIQGQ